MGASKQEQSAQGEKTAKQLREQLEKDLKALQESCTHKILSDWLDQYWAPGHSTGKKVKVCECCDKVIESKDGYPEIQINYTKAAFSTPEEVDKPNQEELWKIVFKEITIECGMNPNKVITDREISMLNKLEEIKSCFILVRREETKP